MDCKDIENKIIEHFENNAELNQNVKEHLANCANCKQVFNDFELLYAQFERNTLFEPANDLKESFDKLILEEEKNMEQTIQLSFNKSTVFSVLKYAAILVIGVIIGVFYKSNQSNQQITELQNDVNETKQMVALALLQNESSSDKIRAAGFISNTQANDEALIALINTFENDKNVSVRLAALNALYNFKEKPVVHQSIVRALNFENDPRVQIRLIDIITQLNDQNAVPEIYKMLQENDLNEIVKTKAEESIGNLL